MRISSLLSSCVCLAALTSGVAYAQESTEPREAASAQDEIIVTAQRRGENIQDVPISVTAASAAQLEAASIESLMDVRLVAPALNTADRQGYYTSIIRGVGSFTFGVAVEAPVAVYYDGVYIATPSSAAMALDNVERVEVLKGPQGTLFGRNATGGLVQVITRTPDEEFTGRFSAQYDNYDTLTLSGYIGGPIAHGLAADLAIRNSEQGEGFGTNLTTGQDVLQLDREFSARTKWVWTPGESTTFTLIGDYFDSEGSRGTGTGLPGSPSATNPGYVFADLGYDVVSNHPFHNATDGGGVSLRFDQEFGDLTFSSTTSHRQSQLQIETDIDFTPDELSWLQINQSDRQFSQELQLSYDADGRLNWTAGVFYFDLESSFDPFFITRENIDGLIIQEYATETTRSWAAYAQGTYEILDDTRLTLGVRHTQEDREEKDMEVTISIPAIPLVINPPFPDREVSFDNTSYRISLDHRFSEDLLVYASFNTGFKSGGFNANVPGDPPYDPETLQAYEIGFKSDLFNRGLRLNVAAFFNEYEDIQVQKITITGSSIINGASAEIYGLDADFTAQFSPSFSITGGATWVNAEFTDFPTDCPISAPAGGVPIVLGACTGNQLPFASEFTAGAAANYFTPVANGELQASLNVYYNSGVFFEPDNVLEQGGYTLLGASVKWVSPQGFSIGVFGTNLTDERIVDNAYTTQEGSQVVSYGAPRIYGVRVGYEF